MTPEETREAAAVENAMLTQAIRDVRKNLQIMCKLYCDWYGSGPASDAANIFYDVYCCAAHAMDELPTQEGEVTGE